MIGKFLFFLSAATATFIGLSAGAVTTSQNVDIIVTHGAPLTTFTFVNDTGNTLPAGSPVSFGQAFRYGDILPGTYPLIRDAATHVTLPGQQWDEISTWRENGGNGSWRHAVWAAWLPNSLANGATYQVEFVPTAGTYSQSSHQALSVLCGGAAAHNLKIHLTDVRNQDDTVRDSGDATFTVCNNISNAGRDAPRHLRAGNVYDEYEVSGMFVYTSGHQDPLLYAQCILDIFTQASNGTSPGDVRWVCHIHNSWQNVAYNSAGNAGNPGPVGFTNDPQAVSYRPEIDDGASDVLDWSNLDATVASASNPIITASAAGCNSSGESVCLDVPSSTGANTWYQGQATRVSCSGTCTGGLNNGQLYYIYPSGTTSTRSSSGSQYVSLITDPFYNGSFPMTLSQGTGSTTFSTRVQHYTREAWQTLDWSGLDNWSLFGTTTRVTRKVYPAFTAAEARYWQESGLVIPLNLSQPTAPLGPDYSNGLGTNFEPMGRLNVIGGGGPGTRPDLGITNEWANKAFITQAEADWDLARLFTLGTSMHGYSTLLDESTGRISALNNGPPTGPGGNGNGAAYAGLGPLRNQTTWLGLTLGGPPYDLGIAEPDRTLPPGAIYDISGGVFNGGTGNDHMPSFDGFTYMVFGDRHFLDLMQWHGERGFLQQRVGPGPELGQGYYRDNNATFTDGNVYHYWGLTTVCCQGRGSAWLTRDVTNPAALGGDSNIERSYFNDIVTETSNYWPLFLAYMDGPGSTGYSASIYPPDQPDPATAGILSDTFTMGYISSASYIMTTFLHVPVAQTWNSKLQRFYEGVLGGQLPGAPVSYYAIDFNLEPQVHDGSAHQTGFGGNVGQYMNGTDASDFGGWDVAGNVNILSGGQIQTGCCYTYTAGDTLKMLYNGWIGVQSPNPVDQLPGNRWFTIMAPVDNSAHTFYIQCTSADHAAYPTQCPTAGGPFTSFTRGGTSISIPENGHWPKFRLQFDPGTNSNYIDPNYSQYGGQTINGLAILGYNVSHATSDFNTRCGPLPNGADCYNPALLSNWWDPTIVVPGLPTPVNGL
jgi:hypothetical protein